MRSDESGSMPKVNVVLALRSQLARRGVEMMLRHIDSVSGCEPYEKCSHAVEPEVEDWIDEETVVIVALDEIDEAAKYALCRTSSLGAKNLILADELYSTQMSRLDDIPNSGFLSTSELDADTLRDALRCVQDREGSVSTQFFHTGIAIVDDGARSMDAPAEIRMTPREQEVLALMVEGLSNKQIARRLTISEHGAKRHVANILAKLNSPNRTKAVAKALQYGLYEHYGRPHTCVHLFPAANLAFGKEHASTSSRVPSRGDG